ncbi:hypothetical protein [Hymenobacter sp. AT01-02]|uniref:hypothetical protein n=1 Tax=Hymenobacter sp. AT01-02 TaxID=1571877 RepID=UPI000B200BDB|nr:hypothetical protein [Hymenobacter sp. AT01-02]
MNASGAFRRLSLLLLAALLLLSAPACHRYRLPSPKGPPQPKVKKAAPTSDNQSADGRDMSVDKGEVKTQKNSYDKNGLLKKPKYERRRLKRKVGQRKFLGITLPF